MNNAYYGIYCKNILGIKTNVRRFRWIYGTAPLTADEEEYQKCSVKVNVNIIPEKRLEKAEEYDKTFQAYMWDSESKKLFYRQTLFGLPIGYDIRLDGAIIYADIGKNYYRFIKKRIMNLHGIYWLLSDIANTVLLNCGYLTLYASAVFDEASGHGTVLFAPPNTGKTVTATMLCRHFNYSLVGEDIVITDGDRIYGCPWTYSYRKKGKRIDSAGYFSRAKSRENLSYCDVCDISELVTLSRGDPDVKTDKAEVFRQIKILNGYLFGYYNSPIIKILGYFDEKYDIPHKETAEKLLCDMVSHCTCRCIRAKEAADLYRSVRNGVPNEEK